MIYLIILIVVIQNHSNHLNPKNHSSDIEKLLNFLYCITSGTR